jgi:hypothetical protein
MSEQVRELPIIKNCQHPRWIAAYPGKFRFHTDKDWRIDPTCQPHIQGCACLECGAELAELPEPSEKVVYVEKVDNRKFRRAQLAKARDDTWTYTPNAEMSAAIRRRVDAGAKVMQLSKAFGVSDATLYRLLSNPDGKTQIVDAYRISRRLGLEFHIDRIDGLPGDFRVCRIQAGYSLNMASLEMHMNGGVLGDVELGVTSPDYYAAKLRKFIEVHR